MSIHPIGRLGKGNKRGQNISSFDTVRKNVEIKNQNFFVLIVASVRQKYATKSELLVFLFPDHLVFFFLFLTLPLGNALPT